MKVASNKNTSLFILHNFKQTKAKSTLHKIWENADLLLKHRIYSILFSCDDTELFFIFFSLHIPLIICQS